MDKDAKLIHEAYSTLETSRIISSISYMANQDEWEGIEFYLKQLNSKDENILTDIGWKVRELEEEDKLDPEKVERIIDLINKIENV